MITCSRLCLVAGLATSMLAAAARADVPAALDRVPADVLVVTAIKDLSKFHADATAMVNAIGLADAAAPLGMAAMLLDTPGLNKSGSVAMAMMPGAFDDQAEDNPPPLVAVVPVTSYADFTGAFQAQPEGGLMVMEFQGQTMYAKDLGGGWAAMGPDSETVTAFDGSAGRLAAHKTLLGATGNTVSDDSDAIVVANIEGLRPQIEQGLAQFRQQMAFMAQMGGAQAEQMEQSMKMLQLATDAFVRDGQAGIVGIDFDAAGVTFDLAAQFKSGSPSFELYQSQGGAVNLLANVPDLPFLAVYALDTSTPGMKKLLNTMMAVAAPADQPQAMGMMNMMKHADQMDGTAFVLGNTPGLMGGGLFANSFSYIKTSNPSGLVETVKEATESMNGLTQTGIKYTTSYTAGGGDANGKKVDTWSVRMAVDPNDPNAMQAQQAMMGMNMIFGPAGLGGFVGQSKDAVIVTMSRNSMLMAQALDVAEKGGGLGANAKVKDVAAQLPKGSTGVAYIGFGNILEAVGGFMAMMGNALPFQVPADLPPIGMGLTTTGGGLRVSTFMPIDVAKTIGEMSKAGQADEVDAPADDAGAKPRF